MNSEETKAKVRADRAAEENGGKVTWKAAFPISALFENQWILSACLRAAILCDDGLFRVWKGDGHDHEMYDSFFTLGRDSSQFYCAMPVGDHLAIDVGTHGANPLSGRIKLGSIVDDEFVPIGAPLSRLNDAG